MYISFICVQFLSILKLNYVWIGQYSFLYFNNQIDRRYFRIEGGEPEACFIEEALQYISERESGIVMRESAGDRRHSQMPSFEEEEQQDYQVNT